MSIYVSHRRSKLLVRVASISLIAVLGASCSSGFSRLDDPFITASLPTANQREIITKNPAPDQPYPGEVDNLTTASVDKSSRSSRINRIVEQPYPGDVVTRKELPKPTKSTIKVAKRGDRLKPVSLLPETAPEGANETIREASTPVRKRSRRFNAFKRKPQKTNKPAITREIAKVARSKPVSTRSAKAGWTGIGGTRVALGRGETIYNLSKRYGVPAKEIMRANNITDAGSVAAGQQILIPTYTYSRTASVSAPDSSPKTRIARSSRGNKGEIIASRVAVPTPKIRRVVKSQRYSTTLASTRSIETSGKATSSRDGAYKVVSGDTLGGIARQHKVGKDALRKANNIEGSKIRVGQSLIIPKQAGRKNVRVASLAKPATRSRKPVAKVDPFVTGTPSVNARKNPRKFKNNNRPAAYTPPQKSAELARRASVQAATPDQTGVAKFRWPAKGRIVSKFGAKVNGAANDGIDISVPVGTAVKATENGTVIYSGSELEEFGKLILVRHAGGWVSAYAYSSKNLVNRGDRVKRGQTIARSGRSGNATTPKIHFELRRDSKPVNPMKHLRQT